MRETDEVRTYGLGFRLRPEELLFLVAVSVWLKYSYGAISNVVIGLVIVSVYDNR